MLRRARTGYAPPMTSPAASFDPTNPPTPLAEDVRRHWLLDPSLTFLNHGSFGAVPREILAVQSRWREAIERDPIEMIARRISELLQPARWAAGELIGCAADEVGFVTNATSAINAVVRSMRFEPGDRIVAPDHVYNAVRQTLRWVAERDGAEYVEIPVPLPAHDSEELATRMVDALPERTRLFVIDQVSSPTAVRFPIERIITACHERDIEVIVDGAHAPGMVDVDVSELARLGALAWTGNFHKWCFVPKGCAVLHVRADRRHEIHPTTISHFLGEGFQREFEWQGTMDFTPWLTVPASLAFIEETFGWDRLRTHNHHLATWAQGRLAERWGTDPLTPPDGSMLGSMASVVAPKALQERFEEAAELQLALYDDHRVEVPVHSRGEDWLVRVSAQAYNTPEEYERLGDAVLELARTGRTSEPRRRVNPV